MTLSLIPRNYMVEEEHHPEEVSSRLHIWHTQQIRKEMDI